MNRARHQFVYIDFKVSTTTIIGYAEYTWTSLFELNLIGKNCKGYQNNNYWY